MKAKWISILGLSVMAAALCDLSSCAHSQELVSITVTPGSETVGASNIPVNLDFGASVQLRAVGNYIHPTVSKDLTGVVTWSSNDTQMFTVSSTGLLTATGTACGGTIVSATYQTNSSAGGISSSGAIVTGDMQANVVCYTGSGGGNGNPLLAVQFQNANPGSVTSSPAGLGTCESPGPCATQGFLTNTIVTLTATPAGTSSTATWFGCPSTSGNVCTVDLTDNITVEVAFN